ncbi:MAG: branched-chain amino acid ABC transporter permease [Candidatus Rokuibacteriota bacterium]|nr:MAG: branched-chain amino acid ABC transporter permease [Candidatus Rokubacteria bacterium]PYN69699.1 MAG: branched-chain amino acid ABC transporter permease [Candidatus Rokubacteria bacterium]
MDFVAVTAFGIVYTIATLILLALGLAVIFGMMGVINLAQAEFLMVGAYTVLIVTAHGASVWVGIAVAPVVVGLLGLVIERTIIRFLYGRILDTMLATWGLSLGLVGLVTLVFGPTTEGIATPLGHVTVGEYRLSVYSVFVILMAFAVLGLTYGLFNYTRFGLVARATMQNPNMVSALGVNPARVYMGTFAFGAALAGLGGGVMAPLTGVVPTLGLAFIAKIFITVIVGGPVILLGTTTAGVVLGLVESLVSYGSTPIYGQVAMLAFAIILLRLLPQGISGFWRRGV